MNKNHKLNLGGVKLGLGMGTLFALAAGMTPDIILDGMMKKRGFKLKKTEADVEALAAAVEKRERRAARNRRNAEATAAGQQKLARG
jgi:hypothetical protein